MWSCSGSRYQPERGFSLPLAMGFGLVMLITGTTLILRSQSDRIVAEGQRSNQAALSTAEIGLVRYQALLNRYRELALYPSCTNVGNGTTGTCADNSWQKLATSPILQNRFCQGAPTVTQAIQTQGDDAWQDIVADDPTQGQYRLVSYVFSESATNSREGVGTLTVEGRVRQAGTGASATVDVATATARVQVKLPVRQQSLQTDIFPGVWLRSGTSQNRMLRTNVFINDCAADLSQVRTVDSGSHRYGAYVTDIQMPNLPPRPTIAPGNQLGLISANLTLPRSGDLYLLRDGRRVYPYGVTGIRLSSTRKLTVKAGAYDAATGSYAPVQVELYLEGEISGTTTSSPGARIEQICPPAPGSANTTVAPSAASFTASNCQPANLKIFAYAQPAATTGARPGLCLSVSQSLRAMVFAPEYQVGMVGAEGLRGSLWGYSWHPTCGADSATTHIAVTQEADWTHLPTQMPMPTTPRFGPVSDWQRQEVPGI